MADCFKKTGNTFNCVGQWFGMPFKMKALVLFCLILTLCPIKTKAQDEPIYDEITVFFQVQNIGGKEIAAVIRNQEVLLPVADIFDFLQIKTSLSQKMDSVSGFFLTRQSSYLIDQKNNRITYQGKTYQLKSSDFLHTETNLYLLSKYFGEIFGLDCKFTFRSLSVLMTSKLELPAMREMRLETMRQNIGRLKGDIRVDSVIRHSRTPFHFGMADWSVISTQQIGDKTDTRFNLALGSVIAGGEANLFLNLNNNQKIEEKDQFYYLKFVDNSNNWLRQTTFGKVAPDALASIYNPVVGVQLTNSPTTYRRSFGTYPLSDYTNPNWIVELYVNNVLVDYKKADASGFFHFDVPLVYGNSNIRLKFYGPWGEERAKEQQIYVPFTFLPPQQLEYKITSGMVEDSKQSIFSKAVFNYGLTRGITIGSGVEYLSSVASGPLMPFATIATRPFSNLILTGEYTYGVRGKAILNYQMPKDILLELNYTKYKAGQTAVNYNFLEERKAIFTLPLRNKNFTFYNRMTYSNIVLSGTGYSTAEWLISGAVMGVNTNLTNYAMFMEKTDPYIYSNLSFSFRLPYGLLFLPQAQYEYGRHELISVKFGLEKYLFNNGFLSMSYENNLISKIQSAQLSLRYDLPFAQTGFTARQTNDLTTLMETARGSLIADHKSNYLGINNRVNVGKGGIVFSPFLDLNCNNKRDPGEPKVSGLNIRINGGRAEESLRDTIVRVSELEPYLKYIVELDQNSFDNISWKIRNKSLSIAVDPNMYKIVEIPIAVVGEVSGTISREKGKKQEGMGRITINIYGKNSMLAGKTMSEQDGYFSFLGLAPGSYEVRLDSAQLKKLHLIATPSSKSLTIKQSRDGDIAEGFDFILKSTEKETIDTTKTEIPVPEIRINYSDITNKKSAKEKVFEEQKITGLPLSTEGIFLQVGAFIGEKNAQNMAKLMAGVTPYPATVSQENGWYKVNIGPFGSKAEMDNCKKMIVSKNILQANAIHEVNRHIATESMTYPGLLIAQQKQPVKGSEAQKISGQANIPETVPSGEFNPISLQVAAFISENNAARMAKSLAGLIPYPTTVTLDNGWYKVNIGPFSSREEIDNCKKLIASKNILQANAIHEVSGRTGKEQIPTSGTHVAQQKQPENTNPGTEKQIVTPESRIIAGKVAETESAAGQKGTSGTQVTREIESIYLQVAAFIGVNNSHRFVRMLSKRISCPIEVRFENGWYKVLVGGFISKEDFEKCRRNVIINNIAREDELREVIKYKIPKSSPIKISTEKTINQPIENTKITGVKNITSPQTRLSEKQLSEPAVSPERNPGSIRPKMEQPVAAKEYQAWKKYYFVEIGAFKTTGKATKLIRKIENMLPYPLEITFRDNLYKVRYGSFETEAEANECIRQILLKKVSDWSKIKKNHEEIGANSQTELAKIDSDFFIQLGAFSVKDNAVNFYKFMSEKYHYPIVLMEEDGFYKVRFGPFRSLEETKKYREMLQKEGVDCFGRSSTVSYF